MKKGKCQIWQLFVEYLGHHIDALGIHTSSNKLVAITQAPAPGNVTELLSFLGILNYYDKFILNLATLVHPLNELLKSGQSWRWTEEHAAAYEAAKQQLSSAPILVHYDPKLPIHLAGDASSYRIGAMLSQVLPDGADHPIAYPHVSCGPVSATTHNWRKKHCRSWQAFHSGKRPLTGDSYFGTQDPHLLQPDCNVSP